jgi:Protein of unknown function (DUF1569)
VKTLASPRETAEIVRRLRALRPDSAARWGRMSVHQMVCHLSDACCMATGAKSVSDASGLLQRTFVKWMALHLPVPWPPGLLTRPEIDQQSGGTKPGDFAADVVEAIALVQGLATAPNAEWPAHPIFGRMSRAAWLRWGYLHTDHHLRQFGA